MHPIPESRKSPSFRAALVAGLAVLAAAGIILIGPGPGRELSSVAPTPGPGAASAPAPLRLEPAPPADVPRAIVAEVRGRLTHAGRPASEFTEEPAKFGPFYDETTVRVESKDFKVSYDSRTGEFCIFNLPAGKWGVYITCGPFWHNFLTFSAAGRVPRPVELGAAFDWSSAALKPFLIPFSRSEYGGERDILLLPCVLRDLGGQQAFLWTTTTAAAGREDPWVVEVIAPVGIRTTYALNDGDEVVIELPYDSTA